MEKYDYSKGLTFFDIDLIKGEMNCREEIKRIEKLYEEYPGEDDTPLVMRLTESMRQEHKCEDCRHFIKDEEEIWDTCSAFPHGIPDHIRTGGFEHNKPYPADRGVRWEPKDQEGDQ